MGVSHIRVEGPTKRFPWLLGIGSYWRPAEPPDSPRGSDRSAGAGGASPSASAESTRSRQVAVRVARSQTASVRGGSSEAQLAAVARADLWNTDKQRDRVCAPTGLECRL